MNEWLLVEWNVCTGQIQEHQGKYMEEVNTRLNDHQLHMRQKDGWQFQYIYSILGTVIVILLLLWSFCWFRERDRQRYSAIISRQETLVQTKSGQIQQLQDQLGDKKERIQQLETQLQEFNKQFLTFETRMHQYHAQQQANQPQPQQQQPAPTFSFVPPPFYYPAPPQPQPQPNSTSSSTPSS